MQLAQEPFTFPPPTLIGGLRKSEHVPVREQECVCLQLHENILCLSFASQKLSLTSSPKSLKAQPSGEKANKCSLLFLCAFNHFFIYWPIHHPSIAESRLLPPGSPEVCQPSGHSNGVEGQFWPWPAPQELFLPQLWVLLVCGLSRISSSHP